MDIYPAFTVTDYAILNHGACALCSTEWVQVWHDERCWQLEDEDEQ